MIKACLASFALISLSVDALAVVPLVHGHGWRRNCQTICPEGQKLTIQCKYFDEDNVCQGAYLACVYEAAARDKKDD